MPAETITPYPASSRPPALTRVSLLMAGVAAQAALLLYPVLPVWLQQNLTTLLTAPEAGLISPSAAGQPAAWVAGLGWLLGGISGLGWQRVYPAATQNTTARRNSFLLTATGLLLQLLLTAPLAAGNSHPGGVAGLVAGSAAAWLLPFTVLLISGAGQGRLAGLLISGRLRHKQPPACAARLMVIATAVLTLCATLALCSGAGGISGLRCALGLLIDLALLGALLEHLQGQDHPPAGSAE